ncbi:MAG: hypothetical protein QMC85_07400 [Methanocellales archaeon]|nr:hypothetical protein [Methanocellales archaeon]
MPEKLTKEELKKIFEKALEDALEKEVAPGTRLIDFVAEVEGSPGIVVDADVAARTPCTVYKVDDTEMAFSPGIIGTLSKAQIEAYCPTKIYKEEGIAHRVKKFKEAVEVCKEEIKEYPKGERLRPWLECMGREARKRGIEL